MLINPRFSVFELPLNSYSLTFNVIVHKLEYPSLLRADLSMARGRCSCRFCSRVQGTRATLCSRQGDMWSWGGHAAGLCGCHCKSISGGINSPLSQRPQRSTWPWLVTWDSSAHHRGSSLPAHPALHSHESMRHSTEKHKRRCVGVFRGFWCFPPWYFSPAAFLYPCGCH